MKTTTTTSTNIQDNEHHHHHYAIAEENLITLKPSISLTTTTTTSKLTRATSIEAVTNCDTNQTNNSDLNTENNSNNQSTNKHTQTNRLFCIITRHLFMFVNVLLAVAAFCFLIGVMVFWATTTTSKTTTTTTKIAATSPEAATIESRNSIANFIVSLAGQQSEETIHSKSNSNSNSNITPTTTTTIKQPADLEQIILPTNHHSPTLAIQNPQLINRFFKQVYDNLENKSSLHKQSQQTPLNNIVKREQERTTTTTTSISTLISPSTTATQNIQQQVDQIQVNTTNDQSKSLTQQSSSTDHNIHSKSLNNLNDTRQQQQHVRRHQINGNNLTLPISLKKHGYPNKTKQNQQQQHQELPESISIVLDTENFVLYSRCSSMLQVLIDPRTKQAQLSTKPLRLLAHETPVPTTKLNAKSSSSSNRRSRLNHHLPASSNQPRRRKRRARVYDQISLLLSIITVEYELPTATTMSHIEPATATTTTTIGINTQQVSGSSKTSEDVEDNGMQVSNGSGNGELADWLAQLPLEAQQQEMIGPVKLRSNLTELYICFDERGKLDSKVSIIIIHFV